MSPVSCLTCGEVFDEYEPGSVVYFTLFGQVEGWCPTHRVAGCSAVMTPDPEAVF